MDSERIFKEAERNFLKIVIGICNDLRGTNFKISNVDIRFTRRNYENILQKSQVLISMLSNNKIAPQLAFSHCGLFVDPDLAWAMSEKYAKEQEQKAMELAQAQSVNTEEDTEEDVTDNEQ